MLRLVGVLANRGGWWRPIPRLFASDGHALDLGLDSTSGNQTAHDAQNIFKKIWNGLEKQHGRQNMYDFLSSIYILR